MTAELLMQIEATMVIVSLLIIGFSAMIGENFVNPYTKAETVVMVSIVTGFLLLFASTLSLILTWIWS